MLARQILAVITGYLLGSIPSAYIVTRLVLGKDIRRMGSGNVGTLNTLRQVGVLPALAVVLIDLGKGAAAVAIAFWLFDLPPLWVMLAGLAAVVGHLWMLFLKFTGGRGLGPAFGALAVLFLAYGHWQWLLVFLGIVAVPLAITRNIALSTSIGFLALPFITWFGLHSGLSTVMAVVLALIIGLKFLPTAIASWKKTEKKTDFIFDRWQRPKDKHD
jgi:acyl phosphate:glycerol-3-phosphate acyltransferase